MPRPMSISLCPTAAYRYVVVSCLWHFWSICCLICDAMPHFRFTLSISCLLLCCPMSVALGPFAVSLVIGLVWCPFHSVHQLSTVMLLFHVCGTWSICCLICNVMPHVHFSLAISYVLLCCCSMPVVLGSFAVFLVMPCSMSISLCPSAVYCYVVPCLWNVVHLVPYL